MIPGIHRQPADTPAKRRIKEDLRVFGFVGFYGGQEIDSQALVVENPFIYSLRVVLAFKVKLECSVILDDLSDRAEFPEIQRTLRNNAKGPEYLRARR